MVRYGRLGMVWPVGASQGKFRFGVARQERLGKLRLGTACYGMAGKAWLGEDR